MEIHLSGCRNYCIKRKKDTQTRNSVCVIENARGSASVHVRSSRRPVLFCVVLGGVVGGGVGWDNENNTNNNDNSQDTTSTRYNCEAIPTPTGRGETSR